MVMFLLDHVLASVHIGLGDLTIVVGIGIGVFFLIPGTAIGDVIKDLLDEFDIIGIDVIIVVRISKNSPPFLSSGPTILICYKKHRGHTYTNDHV